MGDPGPEVPYLIIGNDRYDLHQPVFIGRAAWCQVRLRDVNVSRCHAVVVPSPLGCYVADLNSKNGIVVNGEAVSVAPLKDLDRFVVGDFAFVFHAPGSKEAEAPVVGRDDGVRVEAHTPIDGVRTHMVRPVRKAGKSSLDLIGRAVREDALQGYEEWNAQTLRFFAPGRLRTSDPGERLLTLYQVARVITSCLDTKELLERLVDVVMDLFEASQGLIALAAGEGELEPRVYRTTETQLRDRYLAYSHTVARSCFESGEALLVTDPLGDPRFATAESIALFSIRSAMAAPLTHRGVCLGVLYLDRREQEGAFDEEDLKTLSAVAAQAGLALANSSLYEDLRRSLEKIERQQEALVQSEKLASMGLLSAGVAHEIRSPLTAIVGNAELMLRIKPEPEDALEMVQRILRAGQQIAAVSESLLGFARKRGKEPEVFDPASAVGEALAIARATGTVTKDFKATLVEELEPDLPAVLGHRRELAQVFLNLVINAAQALQGGGTITVRGRRDERGVRFEVEDTGAGIPAEIQGELFEPFSTCREGGTGLGLWITRTIVEDMGGTIAFETRPGRGTTFVVRLPPAPASKAENEL